MATAKPMDTRRPLHVIDAELSQLNGQISEIKAQLAELTQEYTSLRKAKQVTAEPVGLTRPPVPQSSERATSLADRRVKAADSWQAIDVWVLEKIQELKVQQSDLKDENESTAVIGPLLVTEDLPFGLPGSVACYERMFSSGHNQDCLIHSFLNALSPTFRRLVMSRKNEIAKYFRINVVVDLYNELIAREGDQSRERARMIKDLLTRMGNLDIAVGNFLGVKYKIGILLKDISDNPTTNWVIVGSFKAKVEDYTSDDKYTMLYNPGQWHFEAIRNKCTGQYIFDRTEISGWEASVEAEGLHGLGAMCKIGGQAVKLGDVVKLGDKVFSVIDMENSDDNGSCKYINVVDYNRGQTKKSLYDINTEFKKRQREGRNFSSLKISNIAPHTANCKVLGHVDDHQTGVNYSRGGRITRRRIR
jgi:hypothetical protein